MMLKLLYWAALFFLALWRREQPEAEFQSPSDKTYPPYGQQPKRPLEPTPTHGWHPQEEKHRCYERYYWFGSILLSAVIALGAGLSAVYAYRAAREAHEQAVQARRQADIAEDALAATDRPWVEVVGATVHRVEISPFGVTIELTLEIRNVGRSPALRAIDDVEAMVNTEDNEPARRASDLCGHTVQDRRDDGIGGVIFPDRKRPLRYTRFVLPDDIRLGLDRIRERYTPADGVRSDGNALTSKRAGFAVVGCTTYTFPTGKAGGQTAFVYELARNCGDAATVLRCPFDLDHTAEYSGDQIAVRAAELEGFAR